MAGLGKFRTIEFVLLGLAIALAVILNWDSFANAPLAIDEHVSFWIADGQSPGTLLERSFQYSATPPLYFVLERLSLTLLASILSSGAWSEWMTRFPAACSFIAAVIAIWWFGRNYLTPVAGGIAAILLAIHVGIAPFAVASRPYSLGILLSVLAIHATARVVESPTALRWAMLLVVTLAVVQTHYLFASVWIPQYIWLVRAAHRRVITKQHIAIWTVFLLGCCVSVAPGAWHVWERRDFLNWTTRRPELADLLTIALPFPISTRHGLLGVCAATLPFLWQIVAGRYNPSEWFDIPAWREIAPAVGWCALWFGVPALALWLTGRFWLASVAADRYLVILTPAATLVLAGLCCTMRGSVSPILCVFVFMFWAGVGMRLYHAVPLPDGIRPELNDRYDSARSVDAQWKEAAEHLNRFGRTGEVVLVGSGLTEMSLAPILTDDLLFHDYASCRLGRMYIDGSRRDLRRISLPMFWPNASSKPLDDFYRTAIFRACRAANAGDSPGGTGSFWLIAANDTDVLGASLARMRALVETAGAVPRPEFSRTYGSLIVVCYRCPGKQSE